MLGFEPGEWRRYICWFGDLSEKILGQLVGQYWCLCALSSFHGVYLSVYGILTASSLVVGVSFRAGRSFYQVEVILGLTHFAL